VVGVVTTPDKPAGRGLKIHECDVKIAARELGIATILQPEKLRDEAFLEQLRALQPDLGIVIAFRMLPEVVWAMPRLGTFNLHASLLPEYRGAAPINWAIMNGDTETGVTTFLLNHEIDKGAIIGQVKEPIAPTDTVGSLYERLMNIGAELVLESVERLAKGEVAPLEQPATDEGLRPAPKIFKEDCLIDWGRNGADIVNFVRGLSPYPAAWSRMYKEGQEVGSAKIFNVRFEQANHERTAGEVRTDGRTTLEVACKDGWIALEELQLAGKRRMAVRDLLLGLRDAADYCFTSK
jgi:methionyl-tRNA formyltransferase